VSAALGGLCDTKTFTIFLLISDNRRFGLVEVFAMKTHWSSWGLLMATTALAGLQGTNLTARLDRVSVDRVHSGVVFKCGITIDNPTGRLYTATNLFSMPPGLALRVMDLDGHDLARVFAFPWKMWKFPIAPGSGQWTNLWYGGKIVTEGIAGVVLPENTRSVRIQIEGTLSGSGYTNRVRSNVVQVSVP
jgi:hypothetical protein